MQWMSYEGMTLISPSMPAPCTFRDESVRTWATIGVLGVLYILSFVDRFILALLVGPLQRDLHLTDVQLGLLFGTAFGVFYGLLGLPIARLADRVNRRRLIVVGVTLWSICTVLTGFANSFETIAFLRVGLAIGEAALAPAAYSMIADMFSADRRRLPTMLFTAASLTGPSITYIFGAMAIGFAERLMLEGALGNLREWQLVFFIVGMPGLLLAVIFALVAREPKRAIPPVPAHRENGDVAFLPYLRKNFWLYGGLFGAAGCASMIHSSVMAWSPTYLERSYGWSAQQSGQVFGLMLLVASVVGALTVPLLVPLFNGNRRQDGVVRVAIAMACGTLVFVVAATLMTSPIAYVLLIGGAVYCIAGNTTNILVALQTIAPPNMRATLVALNLACISVFGLGLGPPLAAFVSRLYSGAPGALAYSIGTLGVACSIAAVALLFRALGAYRAYVERMLREQPAPAPVT